MAKMLVLQGCPASGKSTFARKFVEGQSDKWIITNRDSIRRMFGEYWIPSRETLVKDSEYSIILLALSSGFNVVVDDSNLNPKAISDLKIIANKTKAEIEFKRFDVPLDELLKRDKNRENPVGEEVIRNFYKKYYTNVSNKSN